MDIIEFKFNNLVKEQADKIVAGMGYNNRFNNQEPKYNNNHQLVYKVKYASKYNNLRDYKIYDNVIVIKGLKI